VGRPSVRHDECSEPQNADVGRQRSFPVAAGGRCPLSHDGPRSFSFAQYNRTQVLRKELGDGSNWREEVVNSLRPSLVRPSASSASLQCQATSWRLATPPASVCRLHPQSSQPARPSLDWRFPSVASFRVVSTPIMTNANRVGPVNFRHTVCALQLPLPTSAVASGDETAVLTNIVDGGTVDVGITTPEMDKS